MTSLILLFVGLLACIIASAFFSGSEMSYSSANRIRLENLRDEGDKKAARALYIIDRFDDALSAILIGNNLVNIACSSISSVMVILLTGSDKLTWVATVIVTILIIIFGETVPKIVSKRNATGRAMSYSAVIRVIMTILLPVIWLVVKLVNLLCLPFKTEAKDSVDSEETVEELHSIIETAQDEGVLDSDDTQIIQAAIDFSEISAYEVMTARVDVQAMDIDDSWEQKLEIIENTPFSRIPVYQDSIDNIIGVLHLNRFFRSVTESDGEFDIRPLLMPPCHVYKTMKLPKVLSILRSEKQHLAVVTDEYSGTLGVISLEDVMEQIVGEIWDETDTVESEVVEKHEGEFEIDGDLSISEFFELIGLDEDSLDFQSETVGGWTVEVFGTYPDVGDSFEFRDNKVTVLEMDELRVLKILVKKSF